MLIFPSKQERKSGSKSPENRRTLNFPIPSFIRSVLAGYPIPSATLFGLLLGLLFRFGFHLPEVSDWIWFATLVGGGLPIVYQTLKGMLRGQFAADIVAMLAILTAIAIRQPFAGAVVVLMQSGGEAIEAYGFRRASVSLEQLLRRAPRIARRRRGSELEEIDVQEVRENDLLLIRPGDLVPVDGTIVEGTAEIDESALTGEPLTCSKTIGDRVLSGSIDVDGAISIRADRISQESQYAKIVRMVKKAQEEKAPIQRLADRYAIFFTPLTMFLAAIGFLITREWTTVLAVFVVATPCPLILAAPLAVMCGMNKAVDAGIIVKGGGAMEQIASTQVALFDKTGTITSGEPMVESIVSLSDMTEKALLYHAAAIEQCSSHSIAKAIVKKGMEAFPTLPLPLCFREIPGRGVEGEIDGQRYYIGSQGFLEQQIGDNARRSLREKIDRFCGQGKLLVFLMRDCICLGLIILQDHIRPEAPGMIRELYDLGVEEIVMLTGDSNKGNAERIAQQAGIKRVEANLLPEQKVEVVRQFKKAFPFVMMVGDGINDAPALASATVGVAMGARGTAISAESADIVLLVDDLSKVAEAISIGQKMIRIAKESIWIGMGLSFVLMVFAIFGCIAPPVGAALQEVIDIAVILNALRAR